MSNQQLLEPLISSLHNDECPYRYSPNPVDACVYASPAYSPSAYLPMSVLGSVEHQASSRTVFTKDESCPAITLLNDVARTLSSTLDLTEGLTGMMRQVEELFQVEAGWLFLIDPVTGDLVSQVAIGAKVDRTKPVRLPLGQGLAGEVALTGQLRQVNEVTPELGGIARNILCIPLVLRTEIIGVLEVMNKKEAHFAQADVELLKTIASYAALAIENVRLRECILAEQDRVIEAEEQARSRLAHDLHDGPTQLVAGIVMRLDFCQQALLRNPALLAQEIAGIRELANRAAHQLRTMLFELRPLMLETHGLMDALEVFLERRQEEIPAEQPLHMALKIDTDPPGQSISRQDHPVEAAIFAIVQETVNNAIKHAQANNIVVHLNETPAALHVLIADDGQGFDVGQVLVAV